MRLGLLPSAGGGIGSMAAGGQAGRLIDIYFRHYVAAFENITYFSYLREKLTDFTDDTKLLSKIRLVPRSGSLPYRLEAFVMPIRNRDYFRQCNLLRVFQATGAVPALVAKRLYGIPYVTTYGYDYASLAKTEGRPLAWLYLRALERPTLSNANGVIVTTEILADYVSRYLPRERIHLIPNGVDTEIFAPASMYKKTDSPYKILFVGRFEKQKNLPTLLKAMVQVQAQFPAAHLKLIGRGSLAADLKAQAVELGVNVEFAGVLPHKDLPAEFNSATLFVLPSFLEGHPKSLIEAMSCGLPSVVSNCQGNRDVVEDRVTALMYKPDDVSALARQILRLLDPKGRQLAERLGRVAREHVVSRWDLKLLIEREVTLLKSLGG